MDLIDRYIEAYPRKSEKTKKDRRCFLENFKNFLGKPLDQATKQDVERWIEERRGEIKANSLNQELGVIKHFYGWLIDELPIPVGGEELRKTLEKQRQYRKIRQVERLEGEEVSERALSPDTVSELIDKSKAGSHRRAFVLLSYFGLRRSEARLLKADAVDFDNRTIEIRRETTKTPSGVRTLPFAPWMEDFLRVPEGQKFVLGHGSKPYSPAFLNNMMRKYERIAGFRLRPKMLRTSFNTNLRDPLWEEFGRARGDFVLKKLMGHKTSDRSMSEHYMGVGERLEQDKRKAMTELHYMTECGHLFNRSEHLSKR